MLANIANIVVVALVGVIGSRIKKAFSEELSAGLMKVIGLFILYLGITNLSKDTNAVALLISLVLGAGIGEFMDWDGAMTRAGEWVQKKFARGGENNLAEPMVVYFIASCSGAYPIIACFNAGAGNSDMLWTKVILDLVIGLIWATSMGIGLALSAIPMFIYQTPLILLSGVLSPLMTDAMLDILGCVGGVLTIAIGLGFLGICKFKIANYLPALIVAPFVVMLF